MGFLQHLLDPEQNLITAGGAGDSAYERGGDARRKFCIIPLTETDLDKAQAFFLPLKETMLNHRHLDYMTGVNKTT